MTGIQKFDPIDDFDMVALWKFGAEALANEFGISPQEAILSQFYCLEKLLQAETRQMQAGLSVGQFGSLSGYDPDLDFQRLTRADIRRQAINWLEGTAWAGRLDELVESSQRAIKAKAEMGLDI